MSTITKTAGVVSNHTENANSNSRVEGADIFFRLPKYMLVNQINFSGIPEFSKFRAANKTYRNLIDGPLGQWFWGELSIKEGVPFVEGKDRDYKEDFLFLCPITISSRIIGKYLGDVVGKVPLMREDRFIQLRYSQDYFEPKKPKRETHLVIVDPSSLRITVSPKRPLALDASGTLVEVPDVDRQRIVPTEIIVPLSFENLKMLANYPLSRARKINAFSIHSTPEVFTQCNTPPDRNKILIMRKEVVAKNMPFNGKQGQNALVTNYGWKVITARERGLFGAIKILEPGQVPNAKTQSTFTYARSAEPIRLGGRSYKEAVIGGRGQCNMKVFSSRDFLDYSHSGFARADLGVVPGVSAEVLGP